MLKIFLCLTICAGLFVTGQSVGILSRLHHTTTTEQPAEVTTHDKLPNGYYKSNNLPQVEKDCEIRFECKKKLKTAETPKPCVKFCVKYVKCDNSKVIPGVAGQCLELNEEMVAEEYNDCKKDEQSSNTVHFMPVAMIDFPCQPGYLPDSRGRCREVW